MKKKKTLITLLAVVLVMATLLTVFVACKPKPEPKEFTMADAIEEISSSIRNTYLYGGVPFGWDADLNVAGYAIKSQGRIDIESRDNTKLNFEISKAGAEVINISADDTYMYATQNDWKRRFNDFQFYDMIKESAFPTQEENSEIMNFLQIGLSAIFTNETDTFTKTEKNGNQVYVLTGNLGSAVTLIQEMLKMEELNDVIALLAECDIAIEAVVSAGNKLLSFNFDVITPIGDVNIGASKFVMGKDCNPTVNLPDGRESFITTNALNFTLKGDVTLKQNANFNNVKDVYKMSYTLRVDYNIFEALRQSVKTIDGKMTFDPTGLFTDPSNKIYFDLNHKCSDSGAPCGYCSANRSGGGSRGSMLTVAYSPEDFGNQNLNISANVKALLPKGLLDELLGSLPIDIAAMFNEYVFVGLDPLALMMNESNYKTIVGNTATTTDMASEFSDALAGLDIKSMLNPNILGILVDVFDFAKEIQCSDADGVTLGTKQLVNIISLLDDSIGFNLSGVIGSFMTNSDYMNINVSEAMWGDETNCTNNFYEEFLEIDKNSGAYKEFTLGKDSNGNDTPLTAIKNIEWIKDVAGNVAIKQSSIKNYEADGTVVPVSEQELKTLLTKGYVEYNYTEMNGKTGKSTVAIKAVYGVDYSSRVEQTITVVTGLIDAGGLSGLLNLASGFLPGGLDLNLAGGYFTTKVLITDTVGGVVLSQDGVKPVFDPEKIYKANKSDADNRFDPRFKATVTYIGGYAKEVVLEPESMNDLLADTGSASGAYPKGYNDFNLVYRAFGETFIKTVQVVPHTDKTITKKLRVGQSFGTGYRFSPFVMNEDGSAGAAAGTLYSIKTKDGIEASMKMTVTEGDADGIEFRLTNAVGKNEEGEFKVTKEGTYKVALYVGGGFTQTYEIIAKGGASDDVKIPGYSFETCYFDNTLLIDTYRTDNYGNGINASFVLLIPKDGDYVALVQGVDYELFEVMNDSDTKVEEGFFLKRSYATGAQSFKIVFTDAANAANSTRLVLHATDYDNAGFVEKTLESAWDMYKVSASVKTVGDVTAIKYSLKMSEKFQVAGAEFSYTIAHLIPTVPGMPAWGYTETVLNAGDYEIVRLVPAAGGVAEHFEVIEGATLGFTTDGLVNGYDTYIRITKADLAVDKDLKFSFGVKATSHNNKVIASINNK